MDQQAIFLTVRLAALTTLILLVIAVPLGYWLAYGKARWRPLVEAAVALPLVLPPTVLGFYLLVMMGPRTAVGRALSVLFGHTLAFSFAGLVVGSVIFSLPFAVQPMISGFRAIDRDILEAAELLSARPGRILLHVLLPLIQPSLCWLFSVNSTTCVPSRTRLPNRAGGRTAVTVASFSCFL